ncbi:MAG TPA: envelope stress response membrane protein PspC [Allosphingosinicella sp.]|jgi:phage shock protein C
MNARRTRFYRDKLNAKWFGVCAGIADYTGLDTTLVRVGMIILTFLGGPLTLFGYFATAWLAPRKPLELYTRPEDAKFWQGVRASPRRTVKDVRSKFRELDRRLASVETYVTTTNSRLFQEIEQLR